MKMNKSKIIILLSVVSFVVVLSGIYIIANTTVYASSPGSIQGPLGMMERWFGFAKQMNVSQGPGVMQGMIGGDQMHLNSPNGNIQISAAYNQTVLNIVRNDTDVQKLLTQGYTIQTIRPVITTTIQGNGSITMSATKAVVTLDQSATTSGTTTAAGRATVYVDVTAGKVTEIVITTRTIIQK